jgi:glutamate/tyrosine decarboxylase-like PLP-dependent enzyme
MSKLLNLPPEDAWGYCNPGSTFSNLHGVHLGMRKLKNPFIVVANDAHYSLTKAG